VFYLFGRNVHQRIPIVWTRIKHTTVPSQGDRAWASLSFISSELYLFIYPVFVSSLVLETNISLPYRCGHHPFNEGLSATNRKCPRHCGPGYFKVVPEHLR
jgi:hypothetical protein